MKKRFPETPHASSSISPRQPTQRPLYACPSSPKYRPFLPHPLFIKRVRKTFPGPACDQVHGNLFRPHYVTPIISTPTPSFRPTAAASIDLPLLDGPITQMRGPSSDSCIAAQSAAVGKHIPCRLARPALGWKQAFLTLRKHGPRNFDPRLQKEGSLVLPSKCRLELLFDIGDFNLSAQLELPSRFETINRTQPPR
jgi:hypothetical protein